MVSRPPIERIRVMRTGNLQSHNAEIAPASSRIDSAKHASAAQCHVQPREPQEEADGEDHLGMGTREAEGLRATAILIPLRRFFR